MKPARAKSFSAGPLKYLGQSWNVANRSEKFKYSGYCQGEGLFKVGGGICFTGRVTDLVFNFSSSSMFESDKFHEKLALESIPHDVDGKQSKEHASVVGKIRTEIRFNHVQSRVHRHCASSRIEESNDIKKAWNSCFSHLRTSNCLFNSNDYQSNFLKIKCDVLHHMLE